MLSGLWLLGGCVKPLPPAASVPSPGDALYFILVDRFADGFPDAPGTVDKTDPQGWHGGDLAGILANLDHLEAFGVGAVWLSPVSGGRSDPHGQWGAFHGYWVHDIAGVHERFGTEADLVALAEALRARGMRLYLDVVYNHVAPGAPLLAQHPDWFHGNGDIVDWDDPVQAVTHDVHGLPDLAQELPEVYAYLRDASLRLLQTVRPDGFRVDAVKHLPDGFLATLGAELEAASPGFDLLGEIFDGNVETLAHRARADQLDAVFDFPMTYALRGAACGTDPIAKVASLVSADYGGARPVTMLDNHDMPRIASLCGGDADAVALGLALQLTARGQPALTWGTEVGLQGVEEPDNRRDMVFPAGRWPAIGVTARGLLALRSRWPALTGPTTRVVGLGPQGAIMVREGGGEAAMVSAGHGEAPGRWVVPVAPVETLGLVGAGPVLGDLMTVSRVRLERFGPVPPALEAQVQVSVAVRDVPDGVTEVRLVGGGPVLGHWQPDAGVALGEDGIARFVVPNGTVLAYKLVGAGGLWEAHPDRYLLVTTERTRGVWGTDACGTWCAPVVEGTAVATISWEDRALWAAIDAGDGGQVRAALERGADPEARRGSISPLAQVLAANAPTLVYELRHGGARWTAADVRTAFLPQSDPSSREEVFVRAVNTVDARGRTALMLAAANGEHEAVDALLVAGADPERRDLDGQSARDVAATAEVRALLEGG